ncbi:MAG: MBL fold metallo-hydrolase [Beijerinckiaceae bacterium]
MTSMTRRQALAGATAAGAAVMLPGKVEARTIAKVGTRDILVISDGSFAVPPGTFRDVPEAEVQALFTAANFTPTGRNVLNVTLIKDGDEYTLLDAGSGERFLEGSGKLADNLDAAGIDRAKIKRVFFTHAHPDHLWGAVDAMDDSTFPNATFGISETEFAFWANADVYGKLPEDRKSFAAGAQRVFKTLGDKLTRFKPRQEIAPGLLAMESPGHTPGHVHFAVFSRTETVVVLGDALTHPIISFQKPDWANPIDFDPAQGAATRKKLLDEFARDKLAFIGYHLPSPGLGRAEAKDGAFRFVQG